MIDRENLRYIKNILSLQNTDVKLDAVYDILTSIKEEDEFSFYSTLLKYTNPGTDTRLLDSVLKTIRQNRELTKEILDSFGNNQIKSKEKLLALIDKLNILTANSSITIFGCWYGSILIPALAPKVKKIIAIDLDDEVVKIGKNRFFKNFENVSWSVGNVFTKHRQGYSETTLFINTSCEHMLPMKEWPWWKELKNDAYFAFQSNNMDQIEGHINCVYSLDDFKSQLPTNFQVLLTDEFADERGTRYTLVGKIHYYDNTI